MSTKNSVLEAMLSQYEKATTFKNENTFDVKNYFSTFLPDGVNSSQAQIRILPTEGSPFEEVYVHSMKVDGKNRKFTCLAKHGDNPCPFCEAREMLLSTGEKSDEEDAKTYNARLMYVVKVIDRQKEDEGPKFWRFPINYKQDGIMDKIMAAVKMVDEDITDVETGRDLKLSIVRVKNPRGGSYPSVNSVLPIDRSPLSTDKALAESWVNDSKTWKDVYSIKPYDYLKLVVMGEVPAWSKKLEKYVAKSTLENETEESTSDNLDSMISMGNKAQKTEVKETKVIVEEEEEEDNASYNIDADDDDDDDLPF